MTALQIPKSEFDRIRSLWQFTTVDERSGVGQVRLRSDGSRRSWTVTNPHFGMVVAGGSDRQVYDVGLPWPAVHATDYASWTEDDLTVTLEQIGDTPVIRLAGTGGGTLHWNRDLGFPDIDLWSADSDRFGGSASVGVTSLQQLVAIASIKREWDEDGDRLPGSECWLRFDEGSIVISNRSHELGRMDLTLHAPGADSDVQVLVNPDFLRTLCAHLPSSDEVTIRLSRFNDDPIVFEGSDWQAFLMPMTTPHNRLVGDLEDLLEHTFGPLARIRDHDGDYPLRRHGLPIYGHVHEDDASTVWFRVFAVLAGGIDPSTEVFRELNDLNTNGRYARLFHVDRQILAEVDLLVTTLDADELREAVDRITTIASEVMPTLTLVLGGEVAGNDFDRRWAAYRGSVLEAQIVPGRTVVIAGPGAVGEWPYPGPVHVITGWNPSGRSDVGDQWNRNVNQAIAADVIEHGGRFVDGVGRSASGDHAEESLVVWGLDRATVRSMGVRAAQDAIFEVDADEVRLISCVDDKIDVWPRCT